MKAENLPTSEPEPTLSSTYCLNYPVVRSIILSNL